VSVTQATEAGTLYTPGELRAIADVGLPMHMDGARFANALAAMDCAPADITWRAGVDVLVFGGTKNGAMAAELIVAFDKELAKELAPRWHRAGHRLSKMRFLSAQFEAYLANDLWLRNARCANAAARRLARGLDVLRPVAANVVFVRFAPHVAAALRAEGFAFHDWTIFGEGVVRLVCGFTTSDDDVDALLAAVQRLR
jgi:threonine aldolase